MRLIDADALLESERATGIYAGARGCGKTLLTICRNYLHVHVINAPTIDAVPVVRCKDCKHYKPGKYFKDINFCHRLPYYAEKGGLNVADDDFCSYGERRSDD